eukprot:CAMPEP_0197042736 /NCGR_PEP_ID=MMETSP1384-20130603/19059_1 /TAXON_ID=29189 /ORGANISM="Ammonia sp." /LENGTH=1575 /DNA_ID=CAMNT_0042473897 /DNA_START=99 /DNA_END=4826 /DNA_ORIENTATION=+
MSDQDSTSSDHDSEDNEENESSEEESAENEESDSNSEENDESEDDDEDEPIELIQVGDVRSAFSETTGGKNVVTLQQFPAILDALKIKITDKRKTQFFTMLDEEGKNEVAWNTLFYSLRDGQNKYKGMQWGEVIGGLLMEFSASERGRAIQKRLAQKSMISFMESTTGEKVEFHQPEHKAQASLGLALVDKSKQDDQEKPAGASKPTRKLLSYESDEPADGDNDYVGPFQGRVSGLGNQLKPRLSGRSRGMTVDSHATTRKSMLKKRVNATIKAEREEEEKLYDKLGSKIKGPAGDVLSESLKTQQEYLDDLYTKISFIEETLRQKQKAQDLVNGMNNVISLQSTISGIAKSSVETLKSDMSDVLNKSAVHSAHQVAKEISSQLTRMNHTINKTNSILSLQSGTTFSQKLETLERRLKDLEENTSEQMMQFDYFADADRQKSGGTLSRPLTAVSSWGLGLTDSKSNARLLSAKSSKSRHEKDQQSLAAFDFDEKTLESMGVAGMEQQDVKQVIDDMDNIKKSVSSLDDCLQKLVAERLLKLEKSVLSLFGQIAANSKGTNYQLMPVEELGTQLDLQKVTFEQQMQKQELRIKELESLLQHQKDLAEFEKNSSNDERQRLLLAMGRFMQQEAVVKSLRTEMKRELGIKMKQRIAGQQEAATTDGVAAGGARTPIPATPKHATQSSSSGYSMHEESKSDQDNAAIVHEDEEKKASMDEEEKINLYLAGRHLEGNNYELNGKYDRQTANYEKKINEQKERLSLRALKSILEYKSVDDIPEMEEDELPDFMVNGRESDQDLEEKLGFGYEELLRVYRANTRLNIEVSMAKWENAKLQKQMDEITQPVVFRNLTGDAATTAKKIQLQSLIDQINAKKRELTRLQYEEKQMRLVDKYRLEMYRDLKKESNKQHRDMREAKQDVLRKKRMINKLFERTKQKAAKIMDEAAENRKRIADEIQQYEQKKREMILAKAKYEDKMSKSKVQLEEQLINEEVEKHIEIYKEHLEEEANLKAERDYEERLENEKDELNQMLTTRVDELIEDIEKEREQHEQEIKRLNNELERKENQMSEWRENHQRFMQNYNAARSEKAKLAGKVRELELILRETRDEFKKYKETHTAEGDGGAAGGGGMNMNNHGVQPQGPVDPQALYAGFHEPSEELKIARQSYKRMKMASDEQAKQIKTLVREKSDLSELVGRLQKDVEIQRELVAKRDQQMIELQAKFDQEVSGKLRPFVKLVQDVGRDVLHNAPTNFIFNYKKHEFAELEKDLNRDASHWYIHKNHILRTFFHSIEEWFRDQFWLHERIVQCNSSVHAAMQEVLQDTWMETRIQTHAFIRWFGDLNNEEELQLFYTVHLSNEERYFWNLDLYECINDYRAGVVESYYQNYVAEREERREGYWKRHPDVYPLYKQRVVESTKRYKRKQQLNQAQLSYMKSLNLTALEEKDLKKVKEDFEDAQRPSMSGSSKHKTARVSKLTDLNTGSMSSKPRLSANNSSKARLSQSSGSQSAKPRLSQSGSGSNRTQQKRQSGTLTNIHANQKRASGTGSNLHQKRASGTGSRLSQKRMSSLQQTSMFTPQTQ